MLSFSHLEFEILVFLSKIFNISKKGVKSQVFSGLYICPPASASIVKYSGIRRLLGKYYRPARFDQQQKHSTLFVDSFSNPMGENIQINLNLYYPL